MKQISGSTNLSEIAANDKAAKYLFDEWELHCVNCMLAGYDTLQNGMQMHGYSEADLAEAIKELNALLQKDLT